jgi:two-component system, OmpR family, sensor histidine kinase BaeS
MMGQLTRALERSIPGRLDRERMSRRVEEMAERLAQEEHTRARFISKVSHELRTPLTVIKGYVYTLQRAEQDPAKLARLDVINGECERLAYLVEDLLELSRARAGELRVASEAFPLRACVEEVVESLRTVAEQRQIEVELEWRADGELVMGDRNRVRQVFANLLTNGLKYAPAESQVTVRGELDGAELAVSVEDRGRGIAANDLPHVFDEFFQGSDRPAPGAGLGLAIARELTEAHGGSIGVRSALGEGSCFTVRLPVWSEP